MTSSTIAVASTSVARVQGLVDHTGAFQNDATVTLENLENVDKVQVTGISYPLALDYVTGSDGNYEAIIPHGVVVAVSRRYIATFLAVGSQGYRREWIEHVRCVHAEN